MAEYYVVDQNDDQIIGTVHAETVYQAEYRTGISRLNHLRVLDNPPESMLTAYMNWLAG